jgi:iron-sulfur cluster repair protein YtfE (RIC family)
MTSTTPALMQPLRDEHAELLPQIEALRTTADLVGAAPVDALAAHLDRAYAFLRGHLVPHAAAEESALYPAVEEAMASPGATATMARDHLEVLRLIDRLGQLTTEGDASSAPGWESDLRQVLYGLYAILELHFAKEEEIYVPPLEATLDRTSAAALFERLEAAAARARATSQAGGVTATH